MKRFVFRTPSRLKSDFSLKSKMNCFPCFLLLSVHVPPLNHIGLWVDNIDAAVGYLEKRGVRFTAGGIRKGASGHKVTFIHPHSGCGALIELVQAPPEVIAAMKRT